MCIEYSLKWCVHMCRVRAFGCSLNDGERVERRGVVETRGVVKEEERHILEVEVAAITVCVQGMTDSCETLSTILQQTLQKKGEMREESPTEGELHRIRDVL